jgi:hypothetical protein
MSFLPFDHHLCLEWLPDETLFSLCSRYHHMSGHPIPAQTCNVLFGSARAGSSHDMPTYVQRLVDRIEGQLGNAQEVLQSHTLIPYYLSFHQEPNCSMWMNQMATGSSSNWKAKLGLAASQFGAAHPLKACHVCMQCDRQKHGVAYWHVEHQLPGSFICRQHQSSLQLTSDKVSGQNRFGWVLPAQARLMSQSATTDFLAVDTKFAEVSLGFWRLPISFTFDLDRMKTLYRQALVNEGYFHLDATRVDHRRFTDSLKKLIAASSLPTIWPWLASSDTSNHFAQRLLRMCHETSPRWSRHPMSHTPLLVLLFGSWESFWDAYQQQELEGCDATASKFKPTRQPTRRDDCNKVATRSTVIDLIKSGHAVSKAAKLASVSVSTAINWAAAEGIHSPKRPKALKADMRSDLIQKLSLGMNKAEVASSAGITIQSVTRLLFSEPGLHDQWRTTRFLAAKKAARGSWLSIQNGFPDGSSNDWRCLDPAVYAWLYRNDRPWLQHSIQNRPKPVPKSPQRRDWQKRDATLAQKVRLAAVDWQQNNIGGRLTIGDICAVVRGLRQKLSALHKLPLTRQSISDACASSNRTPPGSPPQMSLLG